MKKCFRKTLTHSFRRHSPILTKKIKNFGGVQEEYWYGEKSNTCKMKVEKSTYLWWKWEVQIQCSCSSRNCYIWNVYLSIGYG